MTSGLIGPVVVDAHEDARGAVHVGIYASAIRCLLTYVVAPASGAAGIFMGSIGLMLQLLGSVTAVVGAHRLWVARHRARVPYAAVAMLLTLVAVVSVLHLFARN